ncbi:uncharacterized protein LOC135841106 [Planococcus citri]|uniref:uncharacterized protein LOC135841106 n=1 Tax=Planococcus citri TaxID=170843 RepID=UPI0031F939FF
MAMFLYKLFSVILLFLTIFMKCDAKYEGLFFSRDETSEIYNIPMLKEATARTLDSLVLSSPTAIACPAKSGNEDEFNKLHSFGKNCLFVRNSYEKNYFVDDDMDIEICDIPYKLSLIYDKTTDAFSFGFEMYYEKSKHTGFINSNQENYTGITNLYLRTQILPKTPTEDTENSKLLFLDDKTELGFKWINAFQTKFNFEVNRLIETSYNASYTARGRRKCDNYDLGNGYFRNRDISNLYDELYSDANQKRMLENIKLPTSELSDKNREAACEPEHECFAKWLSVPSELFHYPAAEPTSCSNLLTVPIWKSTIGDVLKNLDIFLHAFSEAFSYPLGNITILAGVQGILELPTNSEDDQSKKMITLGINDMPVPNIIYKIIKFKTEICDKNPNSNQTENEESKKPSCKSTLRAMIVVIHINPYFDRETDRICEDECKNWKWDEIQYRNTAEGRIKSKYIYCCSAMDKKVREQLGIKYEYNNEAEKLNTVSIDDVLSLGHLPLYDYTTENFEPNDVSGLVVESYQLLMEQEQNQSQSHQNH